MLSVPPPQGDCAMIVRIHGHRSLYDFVLLRTMTNFEKNASLQPVDTSQVDHTIPVGALHGDSEENARF